MNIRTKQRLATGTAFAAIGLIVAVIAWTYTEVEDANRQQAQAVEIAIGLTELRLVTFDYQMERLERARAQWHAVSARLDSLIANSNATGAAEKAIVSGLRENRALARSRFAELSSAPAAGHAVAPVDESRRRFESQLLSRLLIVQQDSFSKAFRLTELAAARINAAQQLVFVVILAGLALIALITGGASWLIRRDVLGPIVRLQAGTREIAEGNWGYTLGISGNDEIGDLSRNFDAMTKTLRDAFEQIERKNRNLDALNRELEAFSYSVSHDLRGPLRSMDGFSLELLEDYGDKLDAEGKVALERIRAASQRMGTLIDDLLRLSQVTRTELKPTRVDLSAVAREVADDLEQGQPGRSVDWDIEPGLSVHADLPLTRIAMQNLLSNAWKFTGKTDKPVIRVGALQRDARTVHFVADNGAGFDMAHAGQLFGAFQRLHHAGEFPGTGIGLAIVQRIIRRHGGRIQAEAKPDAGATFFFDLEPVAQ